MSRVRAYRLPLQATISALLLVFILGTAHAEPMPEYEGVYVRTKRGDLIPLQRMHEITDLPYVVFGQSQNCTSCIQMRLSGISSRVLPLNTFGSVERINRNVIKGFVIKSRRIDQQIFLDSLVEIYSHVKGQTLISNQNSGMSNSFEYVVGAFDMNGAFNTRQRTQRLDSSVYQFDFPQKTRDLINHPLEELPPFLTMANCGSNQSNFNIKLIDSVTTEYVYKYEIGGINAVEAAASCGKGLDYQTVYGLALKWNGGVYPIISSADYSMYTKHHKETWGADMQRFLP